MGQVKLEIGGCRSPRAPSRTKRLYKLSMVLESSIVGSTCLAYMSIEVERLNIIILKKITSCLR